MLAIKTNLADVEVFILRRETLHFPDLTLSGPGGGGSEARMAKLTAANQKPLIL